jgi:iron complex transport system substrate-binding protein
MAGGKNLAEKEKLRYPHYSIEEVISKKPEIILITSMKRSDQSSGDLNFWRKWKGIPAVDNNRIHFIESDIIDRPSPRIIDGLEEMARLIHPEAGEKIGKINR